MYIFILTVSKKVFCAFLTFEKHKACLKNRGIKELFLRDENKLYKKVISYA